MRTTRYRVGGGGGSGTPTECTPTAVFAETFGMDDFLQIIYGVAFPDSFALTEDALGVKVGLSDTFGADDRLTLAQLTARFTETFGADDRLTLATVISRYVDSFGFDDALVVVLKPIFGDTFGAVDLLSLVTLISRYVDTVGVTDNFGTTLKLFDTFGIDDRLTFTDLSTTHLDTFGIDDRLTLVTLLPIFTDTFGMDDRLTFVDLMTTHPDIFALTEDALGVKTVLFDTFAHTDDLIPLVVPTFADTYGIDDALTSALIANWTCARSGTPDTDPCGDAWIDQANPTTNHGNETPLIVKGKSTLANDERQGRLKFDFTRYAGMTAKVGGTHTITVRVTNTNVLVAANFSMGLAHNGVTSPFTESTVTWNVPGSVGTAITSVNPSIPANTTQDVVLTMTDAQLNTLLGNWARISMTGPGAAVPVVFNVASREDTTVADRPTYSIELKR